MNSYKVMARAGFIAILAVLSTPVAGAVTPTYQPSTTMGGVVPNSVNTDGKTVSPVSATNPLPVTISTNPLPVTISSVVSTLPTAGTVQPLVDWDDTGYVARGQILDDSRFYKGDAGFTQLFTPSNTSGTEWGSVNLIDRAVPALSLRSPDLPASTTLQVGLLKRIHGIANSGHYVTEFMVAQENRTLSLDRPAQFLYQVDTADSAGNRCLFVISDTVYNQSSSTQVNQWSLVLNSGSFVLGTYTVATNENKELPLDVKLAYTTANGTSGSSCTYAGVRVGNGGTNIFNVGIFNGGPTDTTLTSQGPPFYTVLGTFAFGLNPYISIVNRSDASQTAGVVDLIRERTTYLGTASWTGTGVTPNSNPIWRDSDTSNTPINHLLDFWSLATAGTITTPEIEARPGEKVCFDVTAEAVTGSPSASSLAISFQVSAIEYLGNNLDSYTSSSTPYWQTLTAADGFLGGNISPSDWTAITQAQTSRTIEERCYTAGPNGGLVRVSLALTSTGGTSVKQNVSVSEAVTRTLY